MFDISLSTTVTGFDVELSQSVVSSIVYVKIAGVFAAFPTLVKIAGTFVEKTTLVKVGGSF